MNVRIQERVISSIIATARVIQPARYCEDRVTCWIRAYALAIRVYQISISLREVICRVSDLFRFRHAVHARSFQPKRDSFFSLHTARNAARRTDIVLPWIFRIPISGLLLSRGLYTRHWSKITRVIRPQIRENGSLRFLWNSCFIFLFLYIIYIYIYFFYRRDIVDLIENMDSL